MRAPAVRTPLEAPPSVPHTIAPILERRFAKVEADLTTREIIFTRKDADAGVHGIIEYPDTNSRMRQRGLWFYRDPVREPLPRGLCTIAIRKDADMSMAFIYALEDELIVKPVD
jgi:hypothetical protein